MNIKKFVCSVFGRCCHEWGKYQAWGITYQIRYCEKCGKGKIRNLQLIYERLGKVYI